MTALLLDVGNSRLKWGLLDDEEIIETGSVGLEELEQRGLAALYEQLPQSVDEAVACNVAGEKIARILSGLEPVRFVSSTAEACGITNSYRDPQKLGVDRWVAMIGARASTRSACLVVDAGTAITLDALDPNGAHLGGLILPGFQLMAAALGDRTSDLPKIASAGWNDGIDEPPFAASTTDAILQGIRAAAVGAVERSFRSLSASYHDAELILTGGDAEIIQDDLQWTRVLPHLVLNGLAVLSRTE